MNFENQIGIVRCTSHQAFPSQEPIHYNQSQEFQVSAERDMGEERKGIRTWLTSPQRDLHGVPYSKLQPPFPSFYLVPYLTMLSLFYHCHSVPLAQGLF